MQKHNYATDTKITVLSIIASQVLVDLCDQCTLYLIFPQESVQFTWQPTQHSNNQDDVLHALC